VTYLPELKQKLGLFREFWVLRFEQAVMRAPSCANFAHAIEVMDGLGGCCDEFAVDGRCAFCQLTWRSETLEN
jgi:hypothetical protein